MIGAWWADQILIKVFIFYNVDYFRVVLSYYYNQCQITPYCGYMFQQSNLFTQHFNTLNNSLSSSSVKKSNSLANGNVLKLIGNLESGTIKIQQNQPNIQKPHNQQLSRGQLIKKIEQEKSNLVAKLKDISQSYVLLKNQQLKQSRSLKKSRSIHHTIINGTQQRDKIWKKQINIRSHQNKQRIKLLQEQKNKSIVEEHNKIQHKKLESIEAKRKQHEKIIQSIKSRTKNRIKQNQNSTNHIKQLKNQKKLYQKMRDIFNCKQNIIQQQKQQKLVQIKNQHKPITLQEINEHKQKVYILNKSRWLQKQKQIQQFKLRQKNYQVPYQSIFYKQYAQSRVIEQPFSNRQKIKEYSLHVKQIYQPKIDQQKRKQIQQIIAKQLTQHQNKLQKEKIIVQRIKIKGYQSLQYVRSLPKKKKDNINAKTAEQKTKYQNYIKHSNRIAKDPWQKILQKPINKYDKVLQMRCQQQKIIQKISLDQKKKKALKTGQNSICEEQYIKMIKAKIELLNDEFI